MSDAHDPAARHDQRADALLPAVERRRRRRAHFHRRRQRDRPRRLMVRAEARAAEARIERAGRRPGRAAADRRRDEPARQRRAGAAAVRDLVGDLPEGVAARQSRLPLERIERARRQSGDRRIGALSRSGRLRASAPTSASTRASRWRSIVLGRYVIDAERLRAETFHALDGRSTFPNIVFERDSFNALSGAIGLKANLFGSAAPRRQPAVQARRARPARQGHAVDWIRVQLLGREGRRAGGAGQRMTLHDSHCHFLSSRFFEALGREKYGADAGATADRIAGELGWDPPGAPDALADRWVAELNRHRLTRGVADRERARRRRVGRRRTWRAIRIDSSASSC